MSATSFCRSALTIFCRGGGRRAAVIGPLGDRNARRPDVVGGRAQPSRRASRRSESTLSSTSRSTASARSSTTCIAAPAHRRTTAIRGVAVSPSPGSQVLFEGAELASQSMSFPAAIIVEGVPGNRRGAYVATFVERFSPRALAPVAPPLPARHAIQRDKRDENAPSRLYRRSKPPSTQHPHASAYDNRNRMRAAKRSGDCESRHRCARALNGRRRAPVPATSAHARQERREQPARGQEQRRLDAHARSSPLASPPRPRGNHRRAGRRIAEQKYFSRRAR